MGDFLQLLAWGVTAGDPADYDALIDDINEAALQCSEEL